MSESGELEKPADKGKPDRVIQILKIIVWPLLVLMALVIFREKSVPKEIELDTKGLKISFYLLEAAERGGAANEQPKNPPDPKEIQATAQKASTISLDGVIVLWVDDNPQNQEYERN